MMTFYYKIWHGQNPEGAIILAFREEQSHMTAKGKACEEGFFSWKAYTKLHCKKIKKINTTLNAYPIREVNNHG